ncbi:PepSY-associated TM helix domain-containing protein [uncultured Planktosalinus sp.]|uniref:PepSY-associated TM helix domain-containing protein n=1 Tax=uncultured Planktosalinus sp. TaxID=1810935 RepID=UPI0030DB8739
MSNSTKKIVKITRQFRKFHKYLGISLCVFMFIIAATGLLLAWKKDFDFVPPTQTDVSNAPSLPIERISEIAQTYIIENTDLDPEINRIDIRLTKGAAKVRFEHHYSEVQVGIKSGEILSVKTRTSDIIEQIHDGSIIDFFFKTSSDQVKKTYVTLTCLGLMILSVTGFYLWLNPKRIKNRKKKSTP